MTEISAGIGVGTIVLVVVGIFFPVLLTSIWSFYNSFVSKRNKVREGFSGIHVQLKRRADLIPNLVTTVKGYMAHEQGTLERLTRLRTEFFNTRPDEHAKLMAQDGMIAQALKTIFAVSENYPDLKASANFLKLQESLEETEDQIAASRRIYNANVNEYNTSIEQFPSNLVAKWFSFGEEPFYRAVEESAGTAPQVSFS